MKKAIIIVFISALFIGSGYVFGQRLMTKSDLFHLSYMGNKNEHFARHDAMIFNADALKNTDDIYQILSLNPNLSVYLYFAAQEQFTANYTTLGSDSSNWYGYRLLQGTDPLWWLLTFQCQAGIAGCDTVYFGAEWIKMMNITNFAPPDMFGRLWRDWLTENILYDVQDLEARNVPVKGIILDVTNDTQSWHSMASLFDLNLDGLPDDPDSIDAWWKAGLHAEVERMVQQMGSDFVIFTNGDNTTYEVGAHGTVDEGFLFFNRWYNGFGSGFKASLDYINHWYDEVTIRGINPVNVLLPILQQANDYATLRKAYSAYLTAMDLEATHFGVQVEGTFVWETTPWFDEFEFELGQPLGDPITPTDQTYMIRYFEGGAAICNPTNQSQFVVLDTLYWRFLGVQDPAVNSGNGPFGELLMPPHDGLLLRREEVNGIQPEIQLGFELFHNYPNPFNPSTTISYELSVASHIELTIYNLLGQEVRTLVNEHQVTGRYEVQWDGTNSAGVRVPGGMYFYQLRAGETIKARKMVLMK